MSERALTLDEVRRLLAATIGRDHIILRLLVQIGLRPEELWALRRDDFAGDRLRVNAVTVLALFDFFSPKVAPGSVVSNGGLWIEGNAT